VKFGRNIDAPDDLVEQVVERVLERLKGSPVAAVATVRGDGQDALKVLVDSLRTAAQAAEEVAAKINTPPPNTYSQDDLPPGLSRRAYLRAARDGCFPSQVLNRKVMASRADVDAWVERTAKRRPSKERQGKRAEAREGGQLGDVVERAGFRLLPR